MTSTDLSRSLRLPIPSPARRVSVVLAAIGVFGMSAGAYGQTEAPVEMTYGWWTTASAPAPAPAPALPLPVAPVAPDAPADGMVVQGGAPEVGEVAYAAVEFTYDEAATARQLVLPIAPGSGSVGGALRACAVTGPVLAAQGAPASEGPTFDCGRSATATLQEGTFTFDVSGLAGDGELKVALVAENPASRFVFAAPSVEALRLSLPSVAVPAAVPGAQPGAAAGSEGQEGDAVADPGEQLATGSLEVPAEDGSVGGEAPAPDLAAQPGAAGGPAPASEPGLPAEVAPAPQAEVAFDDAARAAPPAPEDASGRLALLAGAMALFAAVLWATASGRAAAVAPTEVPSA